MSYPSPFNFPGPGESYSTTPTTPLEGIEFQFPQWETVEREQQQQHPRQDQPQQHAQHPRSHPPTPTMYQTIQLEEQPPPPPRVAPGQIHLESAAAAAHLHAHGQGNEGSIGPTGASTTPGLVTRSTRSRPEATHHPYRRPPSAIGTKAAAASTSRRQASSAAHAPSSSSVIQAGRSVSGSSSRSGATVPQHRETVGSGTPSPNPAGTHEEESGKSYLIRADVHVDPESKVFTALLELPGVRKDDVRVTMSYCWYNGVKQVTISGRTRDPFRSSQGGPGKLGKVVKERKYGRFIRTFAVSSDTKLEDIDVTMEDGVLLLKVHNIHRSVEAQVQEVPVR